MQVIGLKIEFSNQNMGTFNPSTKKMQAIAQKI